MAARNEDKQLLTNQLKARRYRNRDWNKHRTGNRKPGTGSGRAVRRAVSGIFN